MLLQLTACRVQVRLLLPTLLGPIGLQLSQCFLVSPFVVRELLAILGFFTLAATKLPSYWLPATPAAGLLSQYVKDFSFENPNAPAIFQSQTAPAIDVQFNIGSNKVGDDVYEVALKIEVRAQAGDQGAFIGMEGFGASAPGPLLMEKFGFTVEEVVAKAKAL